MKLRIGNKKLVYLFAATSAVLFLLISGIYALTNRNIVNGEVVYPEGFELLDSSIDIWQTSEDKKTINARNKFTLRLSSVDRSKDVEIMINYILKSKSTGLTYFQGKSMKQKPGFWMTRLGRIEISAPIDYSCKAIVEKIFDSRVTENIAKTDTPIEIKVGDSIRVRTEWVGLNDDQIKRANVNITKTDTDAVLEAETEDQYKAIKSGLAYFVFSCNFSDDKSKIGQPFSLPILVKGQ